MPLQSIRAALLHPTPHNISRVHVDYVTACLWTYSGALPPKLHRCAVRGVWWFVRGCCSELKNGPGSSSWQTFRAAHAVGAALRPPAALSAAHYLP